jgi:hypothetical protein
MYEGTSSKSIRQADIVLANPPFEDFAASDRPKVAGKQSAEL